LKPSQEILTISKALAAFPNKGNRANGAFFAIWQAVSTLNKVNSFNKVLINLVENLMFFNYFYYNSR